MQAQCALEENNINSKIKKQQKLFNKASYLQITRAGWMIRSNTKIQRFFYTEIFKNCQVTATQLLHTYNFAFARFAGVMVN